MPSVQRVHNDFKNDRNILILMVSLDSGHALVDSYLGETGFTMPMVLDAKLGLASKFGVLGTPTTFIVNRQGNIIASGIGPIDFDLPICAAIGQMYERLDGSGYPNGLRAGQINPLARILGVVDAYCALTEARAYRDQMRADTALIELAAHPEWYDGDVVAALAKVAAAERDTDADPRPAQASADAGTPEAAA